MAKKVNKKPLKKKHNNKRKPKVWHIFRFAERYELPDDVRKNYGRVSPLKYTKAFVGSGWDNESISFAQQLNLIRASNNRAILRNTFEELKEIAANRSRTFRGYLLDEKLKPAEIKRISQWIGEDIQTTKKILDELELIGLIERVDVPDFNPSHDEFPQGSGKRRKFPPKTGNPLKKSRSKTANDKYKHNKKKKPANIKHNYNYRNKQKTTTSPTTTQEPIKPKEADAGMGRARDGSTKNSSRSVIKESRFSQRAKDFGFEIYQALRIPYKPTGLNGRRELIAISNNWMRAESYGLNSKELDYLWNKSIKEAKEKGNTRFNKRYRKSPEAAWTYQFNARLRSLRNKLRVVDA